MKVDNLNKLFAVTSKEVDDNKTKVLFSNFMYKEMNQSSPLKVYIQDIFRAKETENKYVYELFGLKFKNVMVHGVVTSIYNTTETTTNIELSDPTGTVQIYYDATKSQKTPTSDTIKDLKRNFTNIASSSDGNVIIMSRLLNSIYEAKTFSFNEGSYLSVIGDIFVSENNRMVSGYECVVTDIKHDILWIEELKYLYDKFYLANK